MQRVAPSSGQRLAAALALLALLALTLAELAIWRASRHSVPPNIVLIVVDTLRQDYLGSYGFDGDISPAIDAFASGAILFENAISTAPWTQPSVASILTSLHVQAHGLHGFERQKAKSGNREGPRSILALDEGIPTLASSLQRAGYETAAFYANAWLAPESGLGRGFDHYTQVDDFAPGFAKPVLDYLERRSPHRPLFLYLHPMDVHGPYKCNQRDYASLTYSRSLPPDRKLTDREYEELNYLKKIPVSWPSDELRRTLRFWSTCYAAGVRRFDREFAPLLAALQELEQLRNTVVVFTSDHGEGLLEHTGAPLSTKSSEHGYSLYFHQTRVPLLIRLPDSRSAGVRISSPVSLVDIMPTLLALARAPGNFTMHGRDLTPLARGKDEEPSRRIFSSGVKHKSRLVAVQDDTHKLMWVVPDESMVLFDIAEDPGETSNIAAREPRIAQELRAVVTSHLERFERTGPRAPQAKRLTRKTLQQLRALGYLEP